MTGEKRCFVIMGYGEKPDFATGRVLIKPTVEACGLECIRADEIPHSGVIDVPMYRELLCADLVVADLSTNNANALYELGVRHALRPFTTIVIAESQLKYPFDVNHTVIRSYDHLGKFIDYEEVLRFRAELKQAVEEILAKEQKDSPVYTYLTNLQPPAGPLCGPSGPESTTTPVTVEPEGGQVLATGAATDQAIGPIVAQANVAMEKNDFITAKSLLEAVRAVRSGDQRPTANDDYIIQRLAFATYKSNDPTPEAALEAARQLLAALRPQTSNDTETLALWGAVRKRLWEETGQRDHLDAAITSYERGFYLRKDYYNGINLAYLLNVRASVSAEKADAIADFVQANRVRRYVVDICNALLEGKDLTTGMFMNRETSELEARYWVRATLAEALLGQGHKAQSDHWLQEAIQLDVPDWMRETTKEQLAKLQALANDSPLRHIRE